MLNSERSVRTEPASTGFPGAVDSQPQFFPNQVRGLATRDGVHQRQRGSNPVAQTRSSIGATR